MLVRVILMMLVAISSYGNISVADFNSRIDKLSIYIQDANFSASLDLLKDLNQKAKICDFGIYYLRKNNPSYTSELIKALPSSLSTSTYIKLGEKIRQNYHETLDKIEKAKEKIAVKKYFLALKIIIEGFTVFKKTIELIKNDYGLSELVKLPKNLKDMIDQYKKDAENIKNKFDTIKLEKKKKQLLESYSQHLIEVTYKIRNIENFLFLHKTYIEELELNIDFCNRKINSTNNIVFPPKEIENIVKDCDPNSNNNNCSNHQQTNYDLSDFDTQIKDLYNRFQEKKIGIFNYINKKEDIKYRINKICSSPLITCQYTATINEFLQPCYTDGSAVKCAQLEDSDKNYYLLKYNIKDEDNFNKEIKPTEIDQEALSTYIENYKNFIIDKKKFINDFELLENNISIPHILLADENFTKRPIKLSPVDVENEISSFRSHDSPCPYDDEWNITASFIKGGYTYFSTYTPSWGPQIMPQNDDKIWYEKFNYCDNVLNLSKKLYETALLPYASSPRCPGDFSRCRFGVALFDKQKILDISNNIYSLTNDLDKYISDLNKLKDYADGISLEASKLLNEFNTVKSYSDKISKEDMEFELFINDDLKKYINQKIDRIGFFESYELITLLQAIHDAFESKMDYIEYKKGVTKDTIYRKYLDSVDENFDFNRKLKDFGKNFETNSTLDQQFISHLSNIEKYTKFLLSDIKNNDKDSIYEDANNLKGSYNAFKTFDYSSYANKIVAIKEYFDEILDGNLLPDTVFRGEKVVFQENKEIVNKLNRSFWPSCTSGLSYDDPIFKNYLNYEQIRAGLPNIKKLIDIYTSDQYKPVDPNTLPTKYVIDTYNYYPKTLNGPGSVYIYVKFKKLKGRDWGRAYIAIRTSLQDDMYKIESVKGYNGVVDSYKNYFKDHYYIRPNSKGEIAFKFVLLKDHIDDPYFIPFSEIPLAVYMTSSEIYLKNFTGENRNAVGINIANIKYQQQLDENNNSIPDEWEKKNNIDSISADNDGDGLTNDDEYRYGSNPNKKDSDDDGLSDYIEVKYGLNPSDPNDAKADFDNDGVSNIDEITNGFDINDNNSPKDLIYSKITDIDGDTFSVDILAKVSSEINDVNITYSYPSAFKILGATDGEGKVNMQNNTIIVDQLNTGKIANLTFRNKDISSYFNLSLKSNKIFASKMSYEFSFISYVYYLDKYWNFISNPFTKALPLNNFNKCAIVWGYDEDGWFAYSDKYYSILKKHNIPIQDSLAPDSGAWVYCDNNTTVMAKNLEIKNRLFDHLNKKWNLVGINTIVPPEVLFSIYKDIKIIWSWKKGKWYWALNKPDSNNTLNILHKNSAAWIYYDNNQTGQE